MSNNDKVEKHESYAVASFSRVSGSSNLFGTSTDHQHFITLSVKRADLHRDLSRDWVFGHDELIEVAMSEAQFGALISSFNQGSGIPCTLRRFEGKMIPQPPMKNRRAEFQNEFKVTMGEIAKEVEKVEAKAKEFQTKPSITKADRAEFANMVNHIAMQLRSNVPFVTEQFNESMDKIVSEAASEAEGMINMKLSSLGLTALKEQLNTPKPLELEAK